MKILDCTSCLLLLSFGTGLLANSLQVPRYPRGEFQVIPNEPGFWETERAKWRPSPLVLGSLFSITKELQSFGEGKAGIQFRFGREDMGENDNAVRGLLEGGGEEGTSSLETLAEEMSGYSNRKKTGFSTWFGRKKREASCSEGARPGAPNF